ncbi:MAG: N-acetylmuramoyl-L-alanine amidase [Bacteroidia bacterium]|nr:N-acetylmuramoyl-L-alanine amidase [Bacteroidia bacterium]
MSGTRIPLLLLLLLPLMTTHARSEITAMTVVSGSTRFTVPAFTHDKVLYASITELSKRLSFPLWGSAEHAKIEVRVGEARMKLTAGNPFVVVIAQKDNSVSEVYQMPGEVMKTDAAYYVPMPSLLPLLARLMKRSLTLDRDAALLTVTTETAGLARITGSSASNTSPGTTRTQSATNRNIVADETPAAEQPGTTPAKNAGPVSEALAPRAIVPEAATRFDISHLTVDSRKNGVLVRVHSKKKTAKFESELDGEGRLLVSIEGATADIANLRQTPTDGESVTSVMAEQLGGNVRLILGLNGDFTSHKVSRDVRTNDLLVSLYKQVDVHKVVREEQSGPRGGDRSKWKLDCIVIDPGHGGKDPGAIGVSGIKEKNITLGMALKLGKLIEENMPGVRVEYTRKDDTFVPLDKRGQMANAAGGKLFISLHCNSTEKKPSNARGFEVYILRPGRTEEAIRIAEFENSVIKFEKDYEKRYAKLTDENFILINMAQSAYAKYSERVAELMHEKVKRSPQISSKGVKQAGFYVLVGASMPSVLIEAGFLSNTKEEQYLATQAGQSHLARLFYDAIADFAVEYEKSLKE